MSAALGAAAIAQAAFPEQPIGSAVATYYQQARGRTALFSPPYPSWPGGRAPVWAKGSSDDVAFSQDDRAARLIAFDSDATNLAPGAAGRQVYAVRRNSAGGSLGGSLALASVSSSGQPANGASTNPSVDGSTRARPHCVAFASSATNLDAGATAPGTRIYVRDLKTRRTTLVSGAATDAAGPVVDGFCRSVLFSSGNQVWLSLLRAHRVQALAQGGDADLQTNGRGFAYVTGGQVWYRTIAIVRGRAKVGRARLVSADAHGRAGNGPSAAPALDDVGNYVAFESGATNLCVHVCRRVSGDANGSLVDVFRRTLTRHAPTHDRMELVSLGLSGPSGEPQISGAGENVIFTTLASNIRRGSPGYTVANPSRAVMTWTFPRSRGRGSARIVTRPGCYQVCLSAQTHPAMSSRGNYIAYTSVMQEFCVEGRPHFEGERECPATTDVFVHYMGPGPSPFPRSAG